MISRNALARLRVVAGRTAQRLDEALDRGQRRPDLVAGVGDEVRAHPLDHHLLGLLAQRDQGAAAAVAEVDRLDARAELLGAVVAGAERDAAGRGAGQRPADRGEHARDRAARGRAAPAGPGASKLRRAAALAWTTVHLLVDHHDRVRQRLDHRAQHALLRRHPPGLPAQLAAELAHRPQQPAGQRALDLRQRRALLVERQALDPGGDGLELPQARVGDPGAPGEAEQPADEGDRCGDLARRRRAGPAPEPAGALKISASRTSARSLMPPPQPPQHAWLRAGRGAGGLSRPRPCRPARRSWRGPRRA